MIPRLLQIVVLLSFLFGNYFFTKAQINDQDPLIMEYSDQQKFNEAVGILLPYKDLPIGDLVIKAGELFLGASYAPNTLENGNEEKLVINLRTFDCTTFIETCLAMARTIKKGKTDVASYMSELEDIRYRNGHRDQYPSRLHYFTEWISDNTQKGIIDDAINQYGREFKNKVSFMSTHTESYEVLKKFPALVDVIRKQEENISSGKYYFIPKEGVDSLEYLLMNGDIVGITTSINGLDVVHTGLLINKNGHFHLLHASQSNKKVLISNDSLSDFLKPGKTNTGIIVARPVFN